MDPSPQLPDDQFRLLEAMVLASRTGPEHDALDLDALAPEHSEVDRDALYRLDLIAGAGSKPSGAGAFWRVRPLGFDRYEGETAVREARTVTRRGDTETAQSALPAPETGTRSLTFDAVLYKLPWYTAIPRDCPDELADEQTRVLVLIQLRRLYQELAMLRTESELTLFERTMIDEAAMAGLTYAIEALEFQDDIVKFWQDARIGFGIALAKLRSFVSWQALGRAADIVTVALAAPVAITIIENLLHLP